MKHRSLFLVSLFVITIPATVAGAQSMSSTSASAASSDGAQTVRQGFFVSAGGGYGSAGIDCDGCATNRESGPVAYVRFGGTINPHLRLGLEADGWAKTSFGVDEQVAFVTADLYVYPSVANNFWIKGGFGVAVGKESDDVDELKATGAAVAGGIGYDWNVSHGNFVLVPFATYVRQLSGNIKHNGSDTGVSANANVFELGIGLGYRH